MIFLQARGKGSQGRNKVVLLSRVSHKIQKELQTHEAFDRNASFAVPERPQEISVHTRRGRMLQAADREVRTDR